MTSIGVDWQARIDWDELRTTRVERMRHALQEADLGGVLAQRFENLKYLTSVRPFTSLIYYPRYAAFLPAEGEVCLLTEAGDYEIHKRDMPWILDLRVWPYDFDELVQTVGNLLSEHRLTDAKIGYDDVVSHTLISALEAKFPKLQFVDATQKIVAAKAVKHPEEVKVLKQALEIAEIGMATAFGVIKEGVRESDVAAEMMRAMIAAGADTLVSHPQVSTDPLRRMATDKRIRYRDLVLVDINIGFNGYIGDMGRTFVVGKPTKEQKQAFKTQLDCLNKAISLVKHGGSTQAIQDGVREIVESAGLTEYWHAYITGHGVGTGFAPYEQPIIGSRMGFTKELQAGMTIAFEPGIFNPEVGPMRNEEVVLTTESGHELLTRCGYDEKLMD